MIQYVLTVACEEETIIRQVIINGEEKLRKIINLLPADFVIQDVAQNEVLQEDGDEFLEEVKGGQKPFNMEFGNLN